jgi:hypothetical protein
MKHKLLLQLPIEGNQTMIYIQVMISFYNTCFLVEYKFKMFKQQMQNFVYKIYLFKLPNCLIILLALQQGQSIPVMCLQ